MLSTSTVVTVYILCLLFCGAQIEACNSALHPRRITPAEQDFVDCARSRDEATRASMRAFNGNVNCTDEKGYTALVAAIVAGNTDVVDLLAQHPDLNVKDRVRGKEPIMWAVRYNKDDDSVLRTLVQKLAVDVNVGQPRYCHCNCASTHTTLDIIGASLSSHVFVVTIAQHAACFID